MSAASATYPTGEDTIPLSRIAAFMVMVFGMFMAILDIQIVAASLAQIQAGLNASQDEIGWVQTSYLIAEVIMIPLSGILSRILSTRVFFSLSAAGFTLASALCASAGSISEMMIWRAFQGFIGGGMIPGVFAAAFTIFPPSKRNIVSPIIGLVATLAPTLGPIIGGWLSETLSWHWLFLMNVPIGIGVAIAAWILIDFDEAEFHLMKRFDWWGMAGMALFLGALQYVLEEGPSNDWLADEAVRIAAILCLGGALVFFFRAFTAPQPVVDLLAFRNMNFAIGSAFSFAMGIGLYGMTYLYPLYLAGIRGLNSLQIGETMFVSGLAMFASAPLAGFLASKIDLRLMLLIGFVIFGSSSLILVGVNHDWDFQELLIPQIMRGLALMLCMVPINNLALGTLSPERMKNASGLYNLMRNLGGAVGLAVITTILDRRGDLHLARLSETLSISNPEVLNFLSRIQAGLDASLIKNVETSALQILQNMALREANVMAFSDIFWLIAVLFLGMAASALLLRKPQTQASGPAH